MQVPLGHGVGVPHWPQGSQVSTSTPEQPCAAGMHVGEGGQEQVPQVHDAAQGCVPYVLQLAVLPGLHAPCPLHAASAHVPLALQVCVFVPQLPHGTGLVWPGAHTPVHAPFLQVWPVQG